MSWFSTARGRQILAVAILFFLVGLTVLVAMQTVIEVPRSREADITELSKQLTTAGSASGNETSLRQRRIRTTAELHMLDAFWTGASRTQIAASMQDVLRTAARQSGGQIVSTSVLEEEHSATVLSVRARADGTLATLQHVLMTIEAVRPRLFVDTLVITAPSGASTPAHQQTLSFELSTSGYVTADDAAKP